VTCGSDSSMLIAADKKRSTAVEMSACRRMLRVSWREQRSNASIIDEFHASRRLLMEVQSCELKYFGHLITAKNYATSILHGRIDGKRVQYLTDAGLMSSKKTVLKCTPCPEKKETNMFCNISYKTRAIMMKFGT